MTAAHERRSFERRQQGQVIALFAIGLVSFLAMVAVVIDGGTLYLQRRTAQNAADAAALAGARALQQATTQSTATVGAAICTYLQANSFGVVPTASAYFVDTTAATNLGAISLASTCSATPNSWIPNGASGVHVDATIGPYNTYLAGIVGVRQLQATAPATAQVGVLGIPRPDLIPLAACGPDMLISGTSPTPYANILNPDNTINTTMYGGDYVLQGSQMTQNETPPQGSTCPVWNGVSSAWKGKVNISGVTGTLTPPFTLPVDTGNGSIDTVLVNACTSIYGPAGDPTGQTALTSICYLLIPVTAPPNPANQANIVTLACFKMYNGGSGYDKWRGILSPINSNTCNYGVYPPTWTFGNGFNETQVMLTL